MDIPAATDEILARRHWVFDLDGTLTVAIHDFAQIRATLGIAPGIDILGHLAALPESEALAANRKLAEIEDQLVAITEPAAGALALVELLHRRGARLGVLTRNTRDNALRTLQRIGLIPFIAAQHVLGRDEAVAKPDPDGILKLALAWGIAPAGVVMVGDYSFDLLAGRAAGAATIHVDPSGAFRWPDLTDIAVPSLHQLAQAVAQNPCYASVSSS
jgi:HAD superfamily hydrolase (TIGR01549 family)